MTASALAFGIFVTYVIGAFVEHHVLGWILSAFPLVLMIGMIFLPETPVWLLAHNEEEEARKALQRLRGRKTNIEAEFKRLLESKANADAFNKKVELKDLMKGSVLKPFGISLAVMFFQQFTGINAIVNNTVSIFEDAGSSIESRYASIIVGAVQLVCTILSGFVVDLFGRRILLVASALFVTLSMAAMGTFFHLQADWGPEEASDLLGWLPLVSLIVFFAAYSCGMSNVPFIIMGELFPSRYRAVLGPLTSSFNLLCAFAVVRCFPLMFDSMGKDGTFWFFGACTAASIVFVLLFLPETKGPSNSFSSSSFYFNFFSFSIGKSLDEIERLFVKGSKEVAEVAAQDPPAAPYSKEDEAYGRVPNSSSAVYKLRAVGGSSFGATNLGYIHDRNVNADPDYDSDDDVDPDSVPPVPAPI